MQQRFELHDGPLDGLQFISDCSDDKEVRSLAVEFIDHDDFECGSTDLKSTKYDLTDTDDSSDPVVHRFHHDVTLPVRSPVSTDFWSKCEWSMTAGDRHRWNSWRYDIFASAEECRDIAKRYGDSEMNNCIDQFQTLVLQIPQMDPVDR